MSKYGRQHSGSNLSGGVIWILGLCIVAFIIYKIASCNERVKTIHENEMMEINSNKDTIIKK